MKVTIAPGDGIGPEIMDVVLDVLRVADVPLDFERVALGHEVAAEGGDDAVGDQARRSLDSTRVLLKGPTDAPEGSGVEDASDTIRRQYGTFARKRIYRMLPGVPTPIGHRRLGLTIVHETMEPEYEPTERFVDSGVAQSRRFATRNGAQRVLSYAFRMAARKGARRITCAHLADKMRVTDGLFLDVFREVAARHPEIEAEEMTIDRVARKLLVEPESFDVLVVPEMPGNILPDIAAGLVGGLAYSPSASIGRDVAIFEPVHGTARDVVGRDLANPAAMILSATMMLRHLDLVEHATHIEAALEAALFRMHRSPEVRRYVRRFQTSVFRHLMLTELRRDPSDVPGTLPVVQDRLARRNDDAPVSSHPAGLALGSLSSQLDGLA